MSTNKLLKDWASAPGETICERLSAKGIEFDSFAHRMGMGNDKAKSLISGKIHITEDIASKLGSILGSSAQFWINRDYNYRRDEQNVRALNENWVRKLPIKDMVSFKWVASTGDTVNNCMRFFDVVEASDWELRIEEILGNVAFKKSATSEVNELSVAAWLRAGEILATQKPIPKFQPDSFLASLDEVKALTTEENPELFIPALTKICHRSGVAFGLIPPPTKCSVSGATRLLVSGCGLLLLSGRYKTDDHFWFSFFHEAAHLLLHNGKLILEGSEGLSKSEEDEADKYAEKVLIPGSIVSDLAKTTISYRQIMRASKDIRISPGILLGQLQHRGIVQYNHFNKLKIRYNWNTSL